MTQLSPQPLFFDPIFHEKVWGGTLLGDKFKKHIPPGKLIGESWELSGLDPYQSKVASGIHKSKTLQFLLESAGKQLTGRSDRIFPLLVKFIDAAQKLSVQVHPGKTECWYVVDAQKDAKLITGFNRNVDRDILLNAIETKTIESLLNFVSIKPGEVHFLPTGTVHAILGNSLVYEIQQPSDITLRFFDWNRPESPGESRPLHIKEALDVVDMTGNLSYLVKPVTFEFRHYIHSYRLVCRFFAIEEFIFTHQASVALTPRNSMQVISVISGSIEISCAGSSNDLKTGVTILLPTILKEVTIAGDAGAQVLITFIPDIKVDIVDPLIAQKGKQTPGNRNRNQRDRYTHEKDASPECCK